MVLLIHQEMIIKSKIYKKICFACFKIKKIIYSVKKDLNNKFIINDFINKNKKFNIEYLELRNKNNLSKK